MKKNEKKNLRHLSSENTVTNHKLINFAKSPTIRKYLLSLKTKRVKRDFWLLPALIWCTLTPTEKLLSKQLRTKKIRVKNKTPIKRAPKKIVLEKWIKPEIWVKMSFYARKEHKKKIETQEQNAEKARIKKKKARKLFYSKFNRKFKKRWYLSRGKNLRIFILKNGVRKNRKKYAPITWKNNYFKLKKIAKFITFKNRSFKYRSAFRPYGKNLRYIKKSIPGYFKASKFAVGLYKRRKKLKRFSAGRLWLNRRGYKVPWKFVTFKQKKQICRQLYFINRQRDIRRFLHFTTPRRLQEKKLIGIYTKNFTRLKFLRKISIATVQKNFYSRIVNTKARLSTRLISVLKVTKPRKSKIKNYNNRDKRIYLKHLILLRYRWVYLPTFKQFKLFKKFFRRTFKRYRKISKDALFKQKLERHLPKFTGYSSEGLFRLWKPLRRNYSQYWGPSGIVQKFAQALLLMPGPLLVFLKLAPSIAASNFIVKAGALAVNGVSTTIFKSLIPGDIIQVSVLFQKTTRILFNYQKWNYDFRSLQLLSFLQIDYSSMMFMLLRWPHSYELLAPSFLTEKWVRYYVRQFSPLAKKFNAVHGNWSVYKTLVYKRKK